MKRVIVILAMAALVTACGSKKEILPVLSPKVDTMHTFAIYQIGNVAHGELVYLLTKDGYGFRIQSDSLTAKKELLRDSFYFVPNPDSLRVKRISYMYLPKENIIADAGIDVDKAFKKRKVSWFNPADSTGRKPNKDTTKTK